MNDYQEQTLKMLADAMQKKKVADSLQAIATRKVLILQKKCLDAGIKIKDLDKVSRIVNQWN